MQSCCTSLSQGVITGASACASVAADPGDSAPRVPNPAHYDTADESKDMTLPFTCPMSGTSTSALGSRPAASATASTAGAPPMRTAAALMAGMSSGEVPSDYLFRLFQPGATSGPSAMLNAELAALRVEHDAALAAQARLRAEHDAALDMQEGLRIERDATLQAQEWVRAEHDAALEAQERLQAALEAAKEKLGAEKRLRHKAVRELETEREAWARMLADMKAGHGAAGRAARVPNPLGPDNEAETVYLVCTLRASSLSRPQSCSTGIPERRCCFTSARGWDMPEDAHASKPLLSPHRKLPQ
jgi:hypothetical protein